MPAQQYKNHVRYYIPHHFIFYPVVLFVLIFCIKNYLADQENSKAWLIMAGLTFILGWLSFMMRQHYALTNQNRTVRLEMRLRYYQLTETRFDTFEKQLSFAQIAALRFAGDHELPVLVNKTIAENLRPDAIKKLVTDWQEDHMRV
ncbi:MAG: DUF6526 family protein [Chitinophagaceae bacterium]